MSKDNSNTSFSERPIKNPRAVVAGLFVAFAVVGFLILTGGEGVQSLRGHSSPNTQAAAPVVDKSDQVPDIGAVGTLIGAPIEGGGRGKVVILGQDSKDLSDFIDANIAKDDVGMRELMMKGRILTISPGVATARVLDVQWPGTMKVRILSGTRKNEAYWVTTECLRQS